MQPQNTRYRTIKALPNTLCIHPKGLNLNLQALQRARNLQTRLDLPLMVRVPTKTKTPRNTELGLL